MSKSAYHFTGVNFYGSHSEYVVSGSDCGNIFIWDKNTEAIVRLMHGDEGKFSLQEVTECFFQNVEYFPVNWSNFTYKIGLHQVIVA